MKTSDALDLVEAQIGRRSCADETRDAFAPPPVEGTRLRCEDGGDSWSLPARGSEIAELGERRAHEDSHDDPEAEHRRWAVTFLWYGHRGLKTVGDLEASWKAVRAVAAGVAPLAENGRLVLLGKMYATGVPPSVVESVMTSEERGELPGDLLAPIALTEDLRREVAAWVLYEGISVALVDGFDQRELERLRGVAATLGIGQLMVESLVDLCCDEALLRARRIELLREDVGMAVRSLVLPGAAPGAWTGPAATETTSEQEIPGELRATRPWRQ